ncbi:MAG: hypothetical protein QOG87_3126 [Actinomycetota bacterium]|jgi:hypothetical protein
MVAGLTALATVGAAVVVIDRQDHPERVATSLQTPTGEVLSAPVGRWKPGAPTPLRGVRGAMPNAVLSDGRVLVWGTSLGVRPITDGAIYDPKLDAWQHVPSAPIAGFHDYRWAVARDRLAVVGFDAGARLTGGVYDVVASTWTRLPVDDTIRVFFDGLAWDGEDLAVVRVASGGVGHQDDEQLDWRATAPVTRRWRMGSDTWTSGAPSPTGLRNLAAVATDATQVTVWGGTTQSPFTDRPAELEPGSVRADGATYELGSDSWIAVPPAPVGGVNAIAAWLDGSLVIGGFTNDLSDVSELDARVLSYGLQSQSWTALPSPPTGGAGVTDGFLVRHSMMGQSGPQPQFVYLDGAWEEAPLQHLRRWGNIVVATSRTMDNPGDDDFEVQFRVARDTWLPSAEAPFVNRMDAVVVVSGNKVVVIGGQAGPSIAPAAETWILELQPE